MAKKKSKGGKTKTQESSTVGDLIYVDPRRVRFQHSRLRPYFSGCGRSVVQTLDDLRQGKLQPSDLPPIQVIVGPDTDEEQGPWYFSLNNRRLWVLKRLREEGLLPNNEIAVRVRAPKSDAEKQRYSLENCALEAKLMREGPRALSTTATTTASRSKPSNMKSSHSPRESKIKAHDETDGAASILESIALARDDDDNNATDDEEEDEDSSVEAPSRSNPFSVLG